MVDAALGEHADEQDVLVVCSVGARSVWKDKANPFRTHERLRISGVPTLVRWGTPQRLVEEDCADARKLELLFED